MAVQNPSGLYSGGQGIFNSMPYTQIALQQQAKKQAKQEALNQYFHEMRGKINEAGTRVQDIGGDGKTRGIKDDIAEWENHWKLNKEDILRGGVSQQKNDELYANIQRRIEQSKGRAKFQLEQGKAVAEGKFDPNDEDIKGAMSHVNKSIYDPSSYKGDGVSEYGWGDLSPSIPDYDVEKKSKVFDAITKGIDAGKKYDYSKMKNNPITGQAIVPFKKEYSQEQIKHIAAVASEIPTGNSDLAKSARKHYQKLLDNEEYLPELEAMDNAYKAVYGKGAFVSTPQQAAAAEAIIRASVPKEDAEEQEINYAQRQRDKRINISINQNRSNSGSNSENVGNAFDDFVDAEYDKFNIKDGDFYKKDGTAYSGKVYVTPDTLPGSIKSALKSGGFNINDFSGGVDIVVKDGEIQSISNKKIGTITRQSMEGVYQRKTDTEPLKGNRLKFSDNKGNNNPKPPGKTPKYKGLDKNGNPIFE